MKKIHTITIGSMLVAAFCAASFRAFVVRAEIERVRVSIASDSDLARVTASGSDRVAALANQPVSIHAAGRGLPYISLSDGRALPTATVSDRANPTDDQSATPLALATADFDGDGVPDLVSASTAGNQGTITIYRGNICAIYPHSAPCSTTFGLSESPFLSDARSFAVPQAPEFVGAGDFDADGHADLVLTSRNGVSLTLLRGDGAGNFANAESIALAGNVTSMATGALGFRHGPQSVAVGVIGSDGPQLLVYSPAHGALSDQPEAISLREPATSMVFPGSADASSASLAVASGNELLLIHSSHRDAKAQSDTTVEHHQMEFAIAALAVGDFVGDSAEDLALLANDGTVHFYDRYTNATNRIAEAASLPVSTASGSDRVAEASTRSASLLPAKVSTHSKIDLLVLDQSNRQIQIVTNEEVRADALNADGTSALPAKDITPSPRLRVSASFDSQDSPIAVLPMRLNKHAINSLVVLTSKQSAPTVILSEPVEVLLVTNTDDSGAGSLRAALETANATTGLDEIDFSIRPPHFAGAPDNVVIVPESALAAIVDPVTIDGTTIENYDSGRRIAVAGNQQATASVAGLNVLAGNSAISGLAINGFTNSEVFVQSSGNIVEGCFFGTDKTGASAAGGAKGVVINNVADNVIGGSATPARNVISGQQGSGVVIVGAQATNNLVQGNYIGTDASGTSAVGNSLNGIYLDDAPGTEISNNVVAASGGDGIYITDPLNSGRWIQGNAIGIDGDSATLAGKTAEGLAVSSVTAFSNHGNGITIENASDNLIGGDNASNRNIISGNLGNGVSIKGATSQNNVIKNNYVGTNTSGTSALGNSLNGINVEDAPRTEIGNNVVAGNGSDGIYVTTSSNGNGIASAGKSKVRPVTPAGSSATVDLYGNHIGTNAAGATGLPNGDNGSKSESAALSSNNSAIPNHGNGITVNNAANVLIGGDTAADRNIISGNMGNGIEIKGDNSFNNQISNNYIGTNAAGNAAIGNATNGVSITGGDSGGAKTNNSDVTPSVMGGQSIILSHNVISGNGGSGCYVFDQTSGVRKSPDTNSTIAPNGGFGFQTLIANRIGIDAAGTSALPNGGDGITIVNASNIVIGGDTATERNLISGNLGNGIEIEGDNSFHNKISNNYIGTNSIGTAALGNQQNGIVVNLADEASASVATITHDVISGNAGDGIRYVGSGEATAASKSVASSGVSPSVMFAFQTLRANFIGTDAPAGSGGTSASKDSERPAVNATHAIPNGGNGISIINACNIVIGGDTAADRNVISGNNGNGISISGTDATNITVSYNYIGTDATGSTALGNGANGISFTGAGSGGAKANNLDATTLVMGGQAIILFHNVVSGNTSDGIVVDNGSGMSAPNPDSGNVASNSGSGSSPDAMFIFQTLFANRIGTDAAGTSAVPNGGDGITLVNASNIQIGGTNPGDGNTIAFNHGAGISISGNSTNDSIRANSIFSNGGLGIDLAANGPTANDACDGDTGPNNSQNFPVLVEAKSNGTNTSLNGTLAATANSTFTIDFFSSPTQDSSGFGEGQTYLGSITVTTNGGCKANIATTLPVAVTPGAYITATATDSAGNTSEFSAGQLVKRVGPKGGPTPD